MVPLSGVSQNTHDDFQQGGFAASVRTDHSDKFVTLDIDLDVFKYFRAVITEMKVLYFNDRIHTHCNAPEMAVAVRRMFAR